MKLGPVDSGRSQDLSLEVSDFGEYRDWSIRTPEVAAIAGPIIESAALARLASVTFLGILSPRFADVTYGPLFARRERPLTADGSRRNHSLGVALIILQIARFLDMEERAQRYGVAWALLHDIGNWPLSHTGEAAFSRTTGGTTRELRRKMIRGDASLPSSLHLDRSLHEMGVSPDTLIDLLDRRRERLPRDLQEVCTILASAINPDSLEGMWRSGLVFGVDVPHPEEFTNSLCRSLFDINVKRNFSEQVLRFWRQQSVIYRNFINRNTTARWESRWTWAISEMFHETSLIDSLFLSEDSIVDHVMTRGLPEGVEFFRHKQPIEYLVKPPRRRSLDVNVTLDELGSILVHRERRPFGLPR